MKYIYNIFTYKELGVGALEQSQIFKDKKEIIIL